MNLDLDRVPATLDQAVELLDAALTEREKGAWTNMTAAKMFDIYVQASQELITSMPNRPECQRSGAPAQLFDSANRCDAAGFSCLMGIPATTEHLAICNETVKRAADVESGKRMAVALLAAAAHTCE